MTDSAEDDPTATGPVKTLPPDSTAQLLITSYPQSRQTPKIDNVSTLNTVVATEDEYTDYVPGGIRKREYRVYI